MIIRSATVFVCSPGRNFVTLKITTDSGIYGVGDATLNGRELAVATYLEEHCIPCLIGMDARNIEDIWQYFYKGVYWKRGPVTMTALAAIDMALWDIKGKVLNTPVYNLLGGRSRDKLLVYCHANGNTLSETLNDAEHHLKLGYQAIRLQSGIPGIPETYGVAPAGASYEPAKRGLPKVYSWDTDKYLNFIPSLFKEARKSLGEDIALLHDAHHRLTPIQAARLGKELEPYHLFWLEDPVSDELQEHFRLIRQHTTTPIAVGEIFNSVYDCTRLIPEQLIDYLRMTVVHGGGISHIVKTAHLAEVYDVKTGFHGATDLSPITMSAALHVGTAIHNFGIQEHMPHDEKVFDVFKTDYTFTDGFMQVGNAPGLGVEFDEKAALKHPYQRAYLPINRNFDGTLLNW